MIYAKEPQEKKHEKVTKESEKVADASETVEVEDEKKLSKNIVGDKWFLDANVVKKKEPEKKLSKKDAFENLLRDLQRSAKDIRGAAVITKNGLPVAMRLPRDVDSEAFAGMSAALYGASETTMMEIKRSGLYWVYTETEDSTLVIIDAGKSSLVVAFIKAGTNIGLALMKLKSAADEVKKLMG